MLSNYRNYEAVEPLQRVTAHVADVKAKRELIHVAMQMLLGNLMVNAIHSALEHSPDAFNAVRADAVLAVLSGSVVDAIVAEEQTIKANVASGFIAENRRADFNVGVNSTLDGCRVGRVHGHRHGASAALPDAQHGSLTDTATPSPQFLVFVLVGFLPSDVALVYFDDAAQLVKVVVRATRFAETLQHEPCRLLSNANLFSELQTGNALACGYEQVHRIEPLVQRDVAALEDRPCTDREIKGTGIAAVEANLRLLPDAVTALALGAERPVRPEPRFQIETRRLRRREHLEKLEGTDCAF